MKERAMIKFDPALANLLAFLAVLSAICYLASGRVNTVDLSIMTGLIGVLGSFRPWLAEQKKVEIDQPANNPVPTTETPATGEGELPPEKRL